MAEQRPALALQENILSLLCYSKDHGRIIARMVRPELFEGDYRILAEQAINYWHKYNDAPDLHTADLLSDIIENREDRRAPMFRHLVQQLAALAPNVNSRYAIDTCARFVRLQHVKQTILKAGAQINRNDDLALEQVDEMFSELLAARSVNFEAGTRLTDIERALAAMEKRQKEFMSGIGVLDRRGVVPWRGAAYIMIAPKGIGKSWFLINVSKRALLAGQRVVHISLENDADITLLRYYQCLFAVPRHRAREYKRTALILDENGKLSDFEEHTFQPDFTLSSRDVVAELTTHTGTIRNDNLIIKRFPKRYLTPTLLRVYLDNLIEVEHFEPDMLVIDYPQLMKIDVRNWRIDMGRNYEEIEHILVERDMAGVFVHQSSREGAGAKLTRATHANEDYSIVQSSDTVLTMSATETERQYGLARVFVDHAREERDKFGCLITQDYNTGQFCLESSPLPPLYDDMLRNYTDVALGEAPGTAAENQERSVATGGNRSIFRPSPRQRGSR